MKLSVVPIELAEANAFVTKHHRHHRAVVGHRFSLGAAAGGKIVGVAIVGRPVARGNQDGWTVEVNRVATDGEANCCSFLYGAARKAGVRSRLHTDHHLHLARGRRGITAWRGLQTPR